MGGYESYRIKDVFEQILKYKPDLVVVLSGNNEGGTYTCPALAFNAQNRWRRLLERYYALNSDARSAGIQATLKIHETRLAEMAALARGNKIPLIFCALPANLSGMPPPGAPPLQNPGFAAAMAAYEKGRLKEAESLFGTNLKADPADLFAGFYLAKTLQALGRFAEARQAYLRVLELDARQDRASGSRNAMIRRAAAGGGAGLCDLDKAFTEISPNGIPGLEQFSDAVHWRPQYNALAWSEIARTARDMGLAWFVLPRPAETQQALTPEELRRSFSYTVSYLDNSSSGLMNKEEAEAGIPCEKAIEEMAFLDSKNPGLLEKTALSARAFKDYFIDNFWSRQTAGRAEQLRPVFLANLAEMERRRGNFRKALDLLKSAEAAGPARPYYRLTKALALFELGRISEARQELENLYAVPALKRKALAAARARGLDAPTGTKTDPEPAAAGGK